MPSGDQSRHATTRLEDACSLAAYLIVPAAWAAIAMHHEWVGLVLGLAAFPVAIKGRIGGFIQLPLAVNYVSVIVLAIVRLLR